MGAAFLVWLVSFIPADFGCVKVDVFIDVIVLAGEGGDGMQTVMCLFLCQGEFSVSFLPALWI